MGEQRKKSRRELAQAGELSTTIEWTPEELAEREAVDWDEQDRISEARRLAGYPSPDRDDELAGYPDRTTDNN